MKCERVGVRASKCTNKATKPDWVHASLELCKRKNKGRCVFRCTERSSVHQRDLLHPLSSPLWIRKNGSVPTRHFFITRLRHYFEKDVAGQSMRAGGATSLAEHGVPPSLIQFMGRWSSDAFFIYIRKSPVLIQALLYSGHAWFLSSTYIGHFLDIISFYRFSFHQKTISYLISSLLSSFFII